MKETLRVRGDDWSPLSVTDRMFCFDVDHVLIGLDLPSADRVREALSWLAVSSLLPLRSLDTDGLRWRPFTPAQRVRAGEQLISVDDSDQQPSDTLTAFDGRPLAGAPFHLVLGRDWLALRASHALMDGWSMLAMLDSLLRVSRSAPCQGLQEVTEGRRNLMLARFLVRHPRAVAEAVGYLGRRPRSGAAPRQTDCEARPRLTTATTSLVDARSLRSTRDCHWPSATIAGLVLVGVRAGLRTVGLSPRPGGEVLFDTRRYFARQRLFGNWATGLKVQPDDDLSPEQVSACMAEQVATGLPVAAMAGMRVLNASAGPHRMTQEMPGGGPQLSYSFTPRHAMGTLPWREDGPRTLLRHSRPATRDGLSVAVHDLGAALSINITHDETVWPGRLVDSAVNAFLTDPVAVIASEGSDQPRRATGA